MTVSVGMGAGRGRIAGAAGGVYITAGPLEQWITEAVLLRLDSPDMTRVLTGGPDEQAAKDLADAIEKNDTRLADLADSWADGEITRAEWPRAG